MWAIFVITYKQSPQYFIQTQKMHRSSVCEISRSQNFFADSWKTFQMNGKGLSESEKKLMVDLHNQQRRKVNNLRSILFLQSIFDGNHSSGLGCNEL